MNKFSLKFLVALLFGAMSGLMAQSNQYLHFDKVDDYVETPNGSGLVASSPGITMAGWFYHDALSYGQGMMSIRGGGTGTGEMYLIQLNNGTVECRLVTSTGLHEVVAPNFSVVPQVWQHWAWVFDGSSVKLFVNGTLKGSKNASGTFTATNKPFTVGKCILGGFDFVFGGRADEVSLWNKALTQQEIQDMIDNELNGDEAGLQAYYKFNQGVPDGDNTSISKLDSETGDDQDGNLLNFALTGNTSNFGGVLDVSFQAITFPQIPTKLVTDQPFQLDATASSGLPVVYEIISGPATLNGNTVTLTGVPGDVTVKASQGGDGTYDPAVDLFNTFAVLDPNTYVPTIDARSPLAGDVFVPTLKPIQLAAIASIGYAPLFSVDGLKFEIDGTEIPAKDWGNGHYTAWWTPTAYGSKQVKIISTNNFGAAATETVNINIVNTATDMSVTAFQNVWADVNNGMVEIEAELPSYLGAFDKITASLSIGCPTGGCDPWDRVSGIEIKGHNGEWYELFRYITPYGVACAHSIDVTDFMSALQGKIKFRVNLGTLGNGFLYSLELDYEQGNPANPYSSITPVWEETFNFGNPANLQPVPEKSIAVPANTKAAKLKLVSTGHGWGDNNTGNAAEFHEDTHHIWVNGAQTFEQHNWQTCNPNPDGCSPQNGTWFHSRAGWCPGSIAPWFDYDMAAFINQSSVALDYVFNEDYIDLCNADNPNCVNTATCNCSDGFNPHLIVSCYFITNSDTPIDGGGSVDTQPVFEQLAFTAYPNPTTGKLNILLENTGDAIAVKVFNSVGQVVRTVKEGSNIGQTTLSLEGLPKGLYTVEVQTEKAVGTKKIVLE
jgi:Concanavalin A-like lectin/glucanases superfamily/Peptide-N-glycosidase F, C terminal/Secretion system C-terminal sorting domain